MILFLLSFLIVFVSSYLFASIFETKKFTTGILYGILIFFAQIVLTIETLSLFNAISKTGVLSLNILFLLFSVLVWNTKGKPLYKPNFKTFSIGILKALKQDKILLIMGIGWVFFILTSLLLCAIIPVYEYDALAYHFNRALVWVSQGSLAHFDIADIRNTYMPINFELLYTWFLTFVYKNTFIRFFTFASYFFMIITLYSLLEILGFCTRKRLWVILLTSAIVGVVAGVSGVQANLLIAALALTCVGLFLLGVKQAKLLPIYFASLSLALAIGTKTTIFFMLPSIGIIFAYFLFKYQRTQAHRYFLVFAVSFIINILIFSAYNYVLNYLNYGNLIGPHSAILSHKSDEVFATKINDMVRHFAMLLDFKGSLKINEQFASTGVLGALLFIPCSLISTIKGYKNYCKLQMIALFGLSLFLNIIVMSVYLIYMPYSARFVTTFLVFSSPILVVSYIKSNRNIFKYLVLLLVLAGFLYSPTQIEYRELGRIFTGIKNKYTLSQIQEDYVCTLTSKYKIRMSYCTMQDELYQLPLGSYIGVFSGIGDNVALLKLMEHDGYKIEFLLTEKVNEYNLNKYDYILFTTKDLRNMDITKNTTALINNYYLNTNNEPVFIDNSKPPCIVAAYKDKDTPMTSEMLQNKTPLKIICRVPFDIITSKNFSLLKRVSYVGYIKNPYATLNDEFVIFKRN